MVAVMELQVSRIDSLGVYEVRVIQSPAGEASGTFRLETSQLYARREELQDVLLSSAVPSRKLLSTGEDRLRHVGGQLFHALFSSTGATGLLRASSAVAAERGERLRLVLRIEAPELAALPWEAMFDPEAGTFLCRTEPLVRNVSVASSPTPLPVRPPLRILALASSPRGLPRLDVEKERDNLHQALEGPIARGLVDLHWSEDATWNGLQDQLLNQQWHVLHFIGHGDYDESTDEGVLALEGSDGRVNRVEAGRFVDLLREAQPMPRLVVLNSCDSGAGGRVDLFSGTAAALARGGVTAVAAMQFEISDGAAIQFCRGFYAAIASGRGVDEAVKSGRVSILGQSGSTLEWVTPILYLRGLDAHLFAIEPPGVSKDWKEESAATVTPRSPADDPGRDATQAVDEALAAHALGDYRTAIPLFDNALASAPQDAAALAGRSEALSQLRIQEAEPVPSSEASPTVESASPVGLEEDVPPPLPPGLVTHLFGDQREPGGAEPVDEEAEPTDLPSEEDEAWDRDSPEATPEEANGAGARRRRRRWLPVLVALVLVGAMAGAGLIWGMDRLPKADAPLLMRQIVWPSQENGNWNIWATNVDTGEKTPLQVGPGNDRLPVTSADRKTIIYMRYSDTSQAGDSQTNRPHLRVIAADGRGDRRLFDAPPEGCLRDNRPAWSAKTKRLAMACETSDNRFRLVLMKLNGSGQKHLDEGNLGDPTFSRDGKTIYYWRDDSGSEAEGGAIYSVAADGSSDPKVITDGQPGEYNDPVCSPDGQWIAFRKAVSKTKMSIVVQRIALGDQPVRELTTGFLDQDPSWSPDSSQLVFRRGARADSDLWLVNLDGGPPVALTSDGNFDTTPAWTPR